MKTIDKLMYKLGYIKYNPTYQPFKELLYQIVKKSVKCGGEVITCNEMGLIIKIQAREAL